MVLNKCLSDWTGCQEYRGCILANQVRNLINLEPSKQPLSTERIANNNFTKEFKSHWLRFLKFFNEWTRRKIIHNPPSHVLPLFSVPPVRPVCTIVWLHAIFCLSSEGCPVKLSILFNVISVKNTLQVRKNYFFWNCAVLWFEHCSYLSCFNMIPSLILLHQTRGI